MHGVGVGFVLLDERPPVDVPRRPQRTLDDAGLVLGDQAALGPVEVDRVERWARSGRDVPSVLGGVVRQRAWQVLVGHVVNSDR
jgi:hypothetical protein